MINEKPGKPALLLLSGGKDSCALAVQLHKAGIKFIACTIDNDLLSDVARKNILKLTRALDCESITIRPNPSAYKKIMDMGMDMAGTCAACTATTVIWAKMVADFFGCKRIYAGYTKYTAEAQGWTKEVEREIDGYLMIYPFMAEYDLKEIKTICEQYGLEIDPTKTNCKWIKKLIDRSKDNPFTRELDLLFKDGQVSQDEYDYYRAFTEPKGKTGAGREKRDPGVPEPVDPAVPV